MIPQGIGDESLRGTLRRTKDGRCDEGWEMRRRMGDATKGGEMRDESMDVSEQDATVSGERGARARSAPGPHWLDREEQVAWRRTIFAMTSLIERMSRVLEEQEDIDLTLSEYEILVRISEQPERRLRMSELADHVVHSRSRMTHTVARMERRGLLVRERCHADGRGREAVLTDVGYALLVHAAPVHVASVRRLLVDRLGHDDFLALGELLARTLPEGTDPVPASLLTSQS